MSNSASTAERLENLESTLSVMQTWMNNFSRHLGVVIEDSLPLPPPAQEILANTKKTMEEASKRLESNVSLKLIRIHRFPHDLRGIGGPDGRYVVPTLVAIGPYHHGRPHLQEMEEVKRAAADSFCWDCRRSVDAVYGKILSITGEARRCYTSTSSPVTDDKYLVKNLSMSDAEFAAMMFLDGCFLLRFMARGGSPPIAGAILSSGPTIVKDILLLENQIPWLVLEALSEFLRSDDVAPAQAMALENLACRFMSSVAAVYFSNRKEKKITSWIKWLQRPLQIFQVKCRRVPAEEANGTGSGDPKPPHLLSLLRSTIIRNMPPEKREGKHANDISLPVSSGAVYLAQIGIKLTPSPASWFADIQVKKKQVLGELSLSPLFLNDVVACLLVNLAALEVTEVSAASNVLCDGYIVCSYLSVLAMLMDREEDVQQLRKKCVLSSHFCNTKTLAFFKDLARHLRLGFNYFTVVKEIDNYMHKRTVRIAVHKFVYNNFKLIAAVLSIASVLVGLFKAIYSLKHT